MRYLLLTAVLFLMSICAVADVIDSGPSRLLIIDPSLAGELVESASVGLDAEGAPPDILYFAPDVSGTGTFTAITSAGPGSGIFVLRAVSLDEIAAPAATIQPATTAGRAVAVPEPGTLALLGIGLIGLGVLRGRRSA